jgi:glycosyltransferase involved in cell wall biosynthesis
MSTRNDAKTVGLVLWKVRQVFEEFRREYHILIADHCSDDGTTEVLEAYQRALPLTLIREVRSSQEGLVREVLKRSDRPRRDCMVTLPGDFSVSPEVLPDLIKRIESGADVVVGEVDDERVGLGMRIVRRSASWLLRPGIRLDGLKDVTSGVYAFRLITLKACLRNLSGPLLRTEGRCANAELVARASAIARQLAVVPIAANPPPGIKRQKEQALSLAVSLFRAGRMLRVPPAQESARRAS